MDQVRIVEDSLRSDMVCLPQISLGLFLNTLTQMNLMKNMNKIRESRWLKEAVNTPSRNIKSQETPISSDLVNIAGMGGGGALLFNSF